MSTKKCHHQKGNEIINKTADTNTKATHTVTNSPTHVAIPIQIFLHVKSHLELLFFCSFFANNKINKNLSKNRLSLLLLIYSICVSLEFTNK